MLMEEELEYNEETLVANEEISKIPLGPITKQLAGIIKTNDDLNYKELLTSALTEKYL